MVLRIRHNTTPTPVKVEKSLKSCVSKKGPLVIHIRPLFHLFSREDKYWSDWPKVLGARYTVEYSEDGEIPSESEVQTILVFIDHPSVSDLS